MKIYDCFGFNDENHLLEIRLNELDKHVDYFVIVEFGETHQGNKKTQSINKDLIDKYKNKIRYYYVDKFENITEPHGRDQYQRNYLSNGLYDADNNDFAITGGNTGTAFAIDSSSGVITTAAALDYETLSSYTLTISVSDGTNAATTETVAITVTDGAVTITNGQTANLAENADDDDTVMTVATSGDSPSLFSINAGNGDGIFAISNTGVITVADNSNLNYEGGTTSYTLTIVATDLTTSDSETVTISITES